MAAKDDKISNNRRRLFKALSAAPVVMTLRPGTAAAGSAYQCAAKEMPTATIKFYKNNTQGCANPTGIDCHVYMERSFWDPGITSAAGNCGFWANKFVVETSPGTYFLINESTSGYSPLTLSGVPAANAVTRPGNGNEMIFYGADGADAGAVACAIVSSSPGLFLAIGGPDDINNPTTWVSRTVWPEEGDTPTNVLGGSCLTSFPSSSGFTLADS